MRIKWVIVKPLNNCAKLFYWGADAKEQSGEQDIYPGTSLWKKLGWEELEEEFWVVAAGLTSLQGATWIGITLDYDAESGRFIRYPWDYTFLSFPATSSCQKPFVEAWLCRNLPLDFSSEACGPWVRCTTERPPSCLPQQCLLQRAYMVGLSNKASEECDSSFSKSKIFISVMFMK